MVSREKKNHLLILIVFKKKKRFIDTDVSAHNFLDCKINNTKIVRLNGSCDMDFDYNIYTSTVWRSNLGGLIPCILAILSVGEAIQRLGRAPVASCCFTIAMILCVMLGFVHQDEIVIWIGEYRFSVVIAYKSIVFSCE